MAAASCCAPVTLAPSTLLITSPLFSPASRAGLGVLPRSELPTTTTPPVRSATPTDCPPGTSTRLGCTDSFTVRMGKRPSRLNVNSPSPASPARSVSPPAASASISAPFVAATFTADDTGSSQAVPAPSITSSGSLCSAPSCGDSISAAVAAASSAPSRRLI